MTQRELERLAVVEALLNDFKIEFKEYKAEQKRYSIDLVKKLEGYQASMLSAFATQDDRINKMTTAISNIKVYFGIAGFFISSAVTYAIFKLTGRG